MSRFFVVICLLLGTSTAACAPTIYRFDATPSRVCKGQTSTLSWAASNRGSITASPPNESPGEVFAEGTSIVTPQASGTYHLESATLIASSGQDVRVEVDSSCDQPGAAPAEGSASPPPSPPAP